MPTDLEPDAEAIHIRGARVHNLADVSVDLPRNALTVLTGVSGSGKSSLAFDTLFAEGQRRYIESLPTFARQFIDQLERPDVDLIEGLQPTLAIDQHAGSTNPRSTVATVTEVYDFLRLLMARAGEPHCFGCGTPIEQQSADQILDVLLALPEQTKLMLLAPLVRGRKGGHGEVFETVRKAGLVRVRVDGAMYDLDHLPNLAVRSNHDIDAVVDRLIIREGLRPRLADSLRIALKLADGSVVALSQPPGAAAHDWTETAFNTKLACPNCGLSFQEVEPRTFSFNSPYGACPTCDGLGSITQFDPELFIPDPTRSLDEGAVAPWRSRPPLKATREMLAAFTKRKKMNTALPWQKLTENQRRELLNGDDSFPGIIGLLEAEYEATNSEKKRGELEAYRGSVVCPACGGSRLRPEARSVTIGGKSIDQITALAVSESVEWLAGVTFSGVAALVGPPLVEEILNRLRFLHEVGLDYLTLDRPAETLSGGERQRIRLAASIGSGLVGVCYVLDEPSIGLHPRDNDRLISAVTRLRDAGNTVIVVEHDEAFMRASDCLVDIGPGAGTLGGKIVAQGTPSAVAADRDSLTGAYLSGRKQIARRARRPIDPKQMITLSGATSHNLKNVTVSIPRGRFTCVTGVSGSGKSSLINETLARALMRQLHEAGPKPGPFTKLEGLEGLERCVPVDQSAIGRSPRSNPATYTGAFDEIRRVFAETRTAKIRGYKPGRFSFNTPGGRCEVCQGQGQQRIAMNFLPDVWITCPACQGRRFDRATLAVRYRDRSIADVLEMRVSEAVEFFENFASLARVLRTLNDVGLGYLPLGQPATTLSGGEAQRIKLATELGRFASGSTVYILDEPTTGLHFEDVRLLLGVLDRLVEAGHTVIVIEHHLDVIKSADWVIDLGPDGGSGGGELLAAGTPEDVAKIPRSHTARFLAEVLAGSD
jgi:excinuclease ABC subunit A